MNTGAFLDVLVVALLVLGGAGGFVINRRLSKLAAAHQELQSALSTFDAAALRAGEALKRLEAGGLARGAALNAATVRAEALLSELSVMTAAGERIADRIDGAVRDVRAIGSGARKTKRAA